MRYSPAITLIVATTLMLLSCKKENNSNPGSMQLSSVYVGTTQLNYPGNTVDVPFDEVLTINFATAIDSISALNNIKIKKNSTEVKYGLSFTNSHRTVVLKPEQPLEEITDYILDISSSLYGENGETFPGIQFAFSTAKGVLTINTITINSQNFMPPLKGKNIALSGTKINITFTDPLSTDQLDSHFYITGGTPMAIKTSGDNKSVELSFSENLKGYTSYTFSISPDLLGAEGKTFNGFTNSFFTTLDSSLKFPMISDDELLTLVQKQTFKFFYDYAHPKSGMARERNGSGNTVTTGGSGFGVIALAVGMERGFITRTDGIAHLTKILAFLETADRFHGAWSHWIDGNTGKVIPFGTKDNGGDLVETAFMAQGLITMRQYLNPSSAEEKLLIDRITALYNGIEWDWYTRGGQNVLYWHWSPNYGWDMNFQLQGYNETLITYIMAAASPTHTIPASAYIQGYARNGGIRNGKSFYGYTLPVGYDYGGPLFFAHYSFLGLDPRNLSDAYANYMVQNTNHSLINWAYCVNNPKKFPNYNSSCWGLTAGDIPSGYGVSEPTNDRGVITPTAAVSSLPFSPVQSMDAIRYFYFILGDKLWGDYGFYDAFSVSQNWWADSYIAIDQGPQICMIENYRTGLPWNLFMGAPEIQAGLTKLGFSYKK
ncbi:MAG: glucoamylase family protein [Bacteroidales bacterium]